MRNKLFLVQATIIALSLFSAGVHAASNEREEIENIVSNWKNDRSIPGIAVAVYNRGEEYFLNFGMSDLEKGVQVDQNTLFEIASISKVFATTLLSWEIHQGYLNVDDPVYTYFPVLSQAANNPIGKVTFRHLATHTSSLPRKLDELGVGSQVPQPKLALLEALLSWRPSQPIGTRYLYSNIAFGFLGQTLEKKNQKSFSQLLKEVISTPLALTSTFVNVPPNLQEKLAQGYRAGGLPARPLDALIPWPAAGGMKSSAQDMMKFLKANLGISSSQSDSALVEAMKISQKVYFHKEHQMGLGWEIQQNQGYTVYRKNGLSYGFTSSMHFIPSEQVGVVILTNQRGSQPDPIAFQIVMGLALKQNLAGN